MAEELFQMDLYYHNVETEKAVLFTNNGDPDDKDDVLWIPRSVLRGFELSKITKPDVMSAKVNVLEWWATKEGLT